MAHHKRKGRAKRNTKASCLCCHPYRCAGNAKDRRPPRDLKQQQTEREDEEARDE